jgi:hypothetical protein
MHSINASIIYLEEFFSTKMITRYSVASIQHPAGLEANVPLGDMCPRRHHGRDEQMQVRFCGVPWQCLMNRVDAAKIEIDDGTTEEMIHSWSSQMINAFAAKNHSIKETRKLVIFFD